MPDDDFATFQKHYSGRHLAEDAWWWLDHPEAPGPSGAAPPQHVFLDAADELTAAGQHEAARALIDVLIEVLRSDRRTALDARALARREPGRHTSDPQRPRRSIE